MILYIWQKGIVKSLLPSRPFSMIDTRIFHTDTSDINSIRQGLCHRMAPHSPVRHSAYTLFTFLCGFVHWPTAVRLWTQLLCVNCHAFCPLSRRNGLFGQPSHPVSSWREIFLSRNFARAGVIYVYLHSQCGALLLILRNKSVFVVAAYDFIIKIYCSE